MDKEKTIQATIKGDKVTETFQDIGVWFNPVEFDYDTDSLRATDKEGNKLEVEHDELYGYPLVRIPELKKGEDFTIRLHYKTARKYG